LLSCLSHSVIITLSRLTCSLTYVVIPRYTTVAPPYHAAMPCLIEPRVVSLLAPVQLALAPPHRGTSPNLQQSHSTLRLLHSFLPLALQDPMLVISSHGELISHEHSCLHHRGCERHLGKGTTWVAHTCMHVIVSCWGKCNDSAEIFHKSVVESSKSMKILHMN
jgi:hypothetical protein